MISIGRPGLNWLFLELSNDGRKNMCKRFLHQSISLQIRTALHFVIVLTCTLPGVSQENSNEAAKSAVDPSGTWKWEREFRETKLRSTLKIKKGKDNSLTGTLQTIFGDGGGPGSDPVKIDNGKIDGKQIAFSVTRNFNGNEFTIDYTGKYSDGKLGGTYQLDFGNGPREFEWQAKRHVAIGDVVGKWSLSFEGPNGQKIESRMTVKTEGEDKLTGTYHSQFFGDSPMKKIVLKEGDLSWDVIFDTDNGEFEVSYSGKPTGNTMSGKITSEFGGQKNETPFVAKLESQPAADEASGKQSDEATE